MTIEQPAFAVTPEAQSVLETLWANGYAAFVVGGAVRDAFLGIPSADWDVATNARPERLLTIFPEGTYENRFGTVRVGGLEITTFRRDHRYADHRRPERVTFSDDVFEDLARRDLTINAIAWGRSSPAGSTRLVDPTDGLGDLRAEIVRAVGDPGRRFDEDALRLLRAVRIAAYLDFTIEPLTLAAIRAHAADVAWVSEERVATEIRRMLATRTPSRALRLLQETDILATVVPELEALVGRPRTGSGPADAFAHALATLDAAAALAPGDETIALAALLHPLGPEACRATLERLRIRGRDVDVICRIVAEVQTDSMASWSDVDVRRFMHRLGPALLDDLVRLRRVHDSTLPTDPTVAPTTSLVKRIAEQRAAGVPLTLAELAIGGDDLREELAVAEGPVVGDILDSLLDIVIVDPAANQREVLLAEARAIVGQAPAVEQASAHRVGSAE